MRSNPFAVEAWFDHSVTLTFAVPLEELRQRLPSCLTPDAFDEKYGFVAVAIVKTRDLRPRGLPKCFGRDFILIGYRYFVRYRDQNGRSLRGLLILRSETDKSQMVRLGNFFTSYHYIRTGIQLHAESDRLIADDPQTGLHIETDLNPSADVPLPADSPFSDWREARRFCGPLPFTFSPDEHRREVRIIEGVRSNWKPNPVRILDWNIPFLDTLGFSEIKTANAFIVRDIPYFWKRGRSESWTP
ncbi:DUF2071 domain-containing protein [Haloferula sp.]|uniref:DUF2071 domain-containing protein n=1 Tax=Haloferula sp. TaxID=2497595 RepID=UPI003C72E9DB